MANDIGQWSQEACSVARPPARPPACRREARAATPARPARARSAVRPSRSRAPSATGTCTTARSRSAPRSSSSARIARCSGWSSPYLRRERRLRLGGNVALRLERPTGRQSNQEERDRHDHPERRDRWRAGGARRISWGAHPSHRRVGARAAILPAFEVDVLQRVRVESASEYQPRTYGATSSTVRVAVDRQVRHFVERDRAPPPPSGRMRRGSSIVRPASAISESKRAFAPAGAVVAVAAPQHEQEACSGRGSRRSTTAARPDTAAWSCSSCSCPTPGWSASTSSPRSRFHMSWIASAILR